MAAHKGKRSVHNKATGKYIKQRARTAKNKLKRIKRNEETRKRKRG
ncbi:MAG: hypothetical protein DDT23_01123 [candidate division WS2 bacterium]|nr:hypothetical protein [Candidatus Lithacetigena glycinireducens]